MLFYIFLLIWPNSLIPFLTIKQRPRQNQTASFMKPLFTMVFSRLYSQYPFQTLMTTLSFLGCIFVKCDSPEHASYFTTPELSFMHRSWSLAVAWIWPMVLQWGLLGLDDYKCPPYLVTITNSGTHMCSTLYKYLNVSFTIFFLHCFLRSFLRFLLLLISLLLSFLFPYSSLLLSFSIYQMANRCDPLDKISLEREC